MGYGGEVPVMVAFNAEGTIEAVQFLDNDERWPGQEGQERSVPEPEARYASRRIRLDIDAITGARRFPPARLPGHQRGYRGAIRKPVWQERTFRPFRPKSCKAVLLPDAGAITPVDVSATV